MKYYVSDRKFSYPKITTKPTKNSAVYATLEDAIRDSEQWKNEHYSDGECLDLIMNWVEQLDNEKEQDMTKQEQLEYIKKKYHYGEVGMYDLLASVSCSELGNDLTLEDAYELYVEAKLWADGDIVEKGEQL